MWLNTQDAHFPLQMGCLECEEKYGANERKKDQLNKEILKRSKGWGGTLETEACQRWGSFLERG